MTVLLIVCGILFAVGFISVGVFARAGSGVSPELTVYIGPLRIPLLKAKTKLPEPKPPSVSATPPRRPKLDTLGDNIGEIMRILAAFLRSVRIGWLRVDVGVGGARDAARAALLYGKAWQAAGIIVPLLEHNNNIKRYAYTIDIDFQRDKSTVYAELDVSVTIGSIVKLMVRAAWLYFFKLRTKTRKGDLAYGKAGS